MLNVVSNRLLPNLRRRERVMSRLAIFGSFIGGAGLILLSIFDTRRHPTLHRVFLLIFVLGVALSAIFTVIEFRWLDKTFGRRARKLRLAYMMKGVLAFILIVLAVAFGVELDKNDDPAAVLEWTIAFGFTIYLLTFYYDLRQSKGHEAGDLSPEALGRNGNARGPMMRQGAPPM